MNSPCVGTPLALVELAAGVAAEAEKPSTGKADPAPLRALTPSTVRALTAATDPPTRSRKVLHTGSRWRAWLIARVNICS